MQTGAALLSRRPHTPPPAVRLGTAGGDAEIALAKGRVHELCGTARRTLALALAARAAGPVVWITQHRATETLNPNALQRFCPPEDILAVNAPRQDMLFWAMEESLRAGSAAAVIGDLAEAPGMTAVRRLHLAAEAGTGAGLYRPICLILTQGQGGSPGIETRWQLEPAHRANAERWSLRRLRARMAPPRDWTLGLGPEGMVPVRPDQRSLVAVTKTPRPNILRAPEKTGHG